MSYGISEWKNAFMYKQSFKGTKCTHLPPTSTEYITKANIALASGIKLL